MSLHSFSVTLFPFGLRLFFIQLQNKLEKGAIAYRNYQKTCISTDTTFGRTIETNHWMTEHLFKTSPHRLSRDQTKGVTTFLRIAYVLKQKVFLKKGELKKKVLYSFIGFSYPS
jgi:hypothetical protein